MGSLKFRQLEPDGANGEILQKVRAIYKTRNQLLLITNADKALWCRTLAKIGSERPLSDRYKLSICYRRSVSNNPLQESLSAWLLFRLFFDTQRSGAPRPPGIFPLHLQDSPDGLSTPLCSILGT